MKSTKKLNLLIALSGLMCCIVLCTNEIGRPNQAPPTQSATSIGNGNNQNTNRAIGCPSGKIMYYEDGDENKPKCGKCIPGTSGLENTLCNLNEYCADNSTCIHIRRHPMYGADCPYELSSSSTGHINSLSFCGPGLHCYQHKCFPCLDGMVDYADGKMCVMKEWTYNKWHATINDPTPTLLVIIAFLIIIYIAFKICIEGIVCFVKSRNCASSQKREEYMETNHQHEYMEEEDDKRNRSEEEFELNQFRNSENDIYRRRRTKSRLQEEYDDEDDDY